MTGPRFEAFLARLYTDEPTRRRFLEDPATVARASGLSEEEVQAALDIDREGLMLTAESFEKKRARR